MKIALATHWPEYLMEAAGLGIFMLSAGGCGIVPVHPASPMMSTVLTVSNVPRIARYTGLCAGILVAAYITLEAPISGMSMNPARSFASALLAGLWTAFWVYVTAPLIGMLLAAELRLRLSPQPVRCAKLHHDNPRRCIFRCGYAR